MAFNIKYIAKNKYKKKIIYLVIVFVAGFIMLMYSKNQNTNKAKDSISINNKEFSIKDQNSETCYCDTIEEKLEEEFTKILGVGKVEVIIILKTKGEIILNKDAPISRSETKERDGEGGERNSQEFSEDTKTVIINNSDGSEKPIIIKEVMPQINGILIIAEGGGDIVVKNNLIKAAKVLLDLPINKIEVMTMQN